MGHRLCLTPLDTATMRFYEILIPCQGLLIKNIYEKNRFWFSIYIITKILNNFKLRALYHGFPNFFAFFISTAAVSFKRHETAADCYIRNNRDSNSSCSVPGRAPPQKTKGASEMIYPEMHPRGQCPRKGAPGFLNKKGLFSAQKCAFWMVGKMFRKTNVLLNTLPRLFDVFNQVSRLAIQQRTNGINGFPRHQFSVPNLL